MKKNNVIRWLLLAGGILLMAAAGWLFSCSGLGLDPLSVFCSGLAALLGVKLGTGFLIVNATVLLVLTFLDRKKIGIGTVAVAVGVGPIINAFLEFIPFEPASLLGKTAASLGAIVAAAVGIALYLEADLGCGPTDAVMLCLNQRTPLSLRISKILLDVIFTFAGWVMGGAVGMGTLAAALLTGPILAAVQKGLNLVFCEGGRPDETNLFDRPGQLRHR